MVRENRFRQDLYYRINVISVTLPPLHERREDIIPIAEMFQVCSKYNVVKFFDQSVLRKFEQYTWPGNIRELRNVTERMVLTSPRDEVRLSLLPRFILEENSPVQVSSASSPVMDEPLSFEIDWENNTKSFKELIHDQEKDLLRSALEYYGTPAKAAKALRIDLSNVYRKIQKYTL